MLKSSSSNEAKHTKLTCYCPLEVVVGKLRSFMLTIFLNDTRTLLTRYLNLRAVARSRCDLLEVAEQKQASLPCRPLLNLASKQVVLQLDGCGLLIAKRALGIFLMRLLG